MGTCPQVASTMYMPIDTSKLKEVCIEVDIVDHLYYLSAQSLFASWAFSNLFPLMRPTIMSII